MGLCPSETPGHNDANSFKRRILGTPGENRCFGCFPGFSCKNHCSCGNGGHAASSADKTVNVAAASCAAGCAFMQNAKTYGIREACIKVLEVTKARKYMARPEFLQGCPERPLHEAVKVKLTLKDVRDPEDCCRHRVEPAQERCVLQLARLERQATQAQGAQ